jgi:two-component system LytT family response regulator/two-component system response regulator LytT
MRDSAAATLTTIVVDDEQLACDELSYLLKDFPEVEVIATGSNGLDAIELIRKLEPDVVFLDVHMPGLDGLGVVRRLREKGIELPHFIFVTAYDQYAVEAFRAAARTKLLVRANNRNFIVDANDVIYATIEDGTITLVTTTIEGHSNYRTVEDLQANLDRDLFWRVHRSYLVNINRIKEVVPWFKSSYQLRMDDRKHTEIPVSRVQTRRLRELFKL